MVQSFTLFIVERVLMIKHLAKRLVNDPLFRLDCGFLASDSVLSEASYTRIVDVIGQSDIMDSIHDQLILIVFIDGFFR